jgi:RNA polymerase sigma factor (sigma-70 family)
LETRSLVIGAQRGDNEAYDALVARYQDIAVAYGYSLLGDFHWAEDAAQEAFIEAASALSSLREPSAFPTWLRAIVFKHCDRLKRKGKVPTVALEAALEIACCGIEPQTMAERREMQSQVREAVEGLPDHERVVVLLFYMGEHSQAEISDFLGLPVTTVKKRLHDARQRLKKRMIEMLKEELQDQRPSKNEEFMERFHKMMSAVDKGDKGEVRHLLQENPVLLDAKGPYYPAGDGEISPLLAAATFNQKDIALFLLEQGADPHSVDRGESTLQAAAFHQNHELIDVLVNRGVSMTVFAASAMGDVRQLENILRAFPHLAMARDSTGATPLHWAGNATVAQVLVNAGADIEAEDKRYKNTPIEYGCIRPDVVDFLRSAGARIRFPMACAIGDVDTARRFLQAQPALAATPNGDRRPEGNTLPLSIAAIYGELDMVEFLLDFGVDVNARNEARGGATALHFAARNGDYEIVDLLIKRGANTSSTTRNNETPLTYAVNGQREGWGKWKGAGLAPRHVEVIALLNTMVDH